MGPYHIVPCLEFSRLLTPLFLYIFPQGRAVIERWQQHKMWLPALVEVLGLPGHTASSHCAMEARDALEAIAGMSPALLNDVLDMLGREVRAQAARVCQSLGPLEQALRRFDASAKRGNPGEAAKHALEVRAILLSTVSAHSELLRTVSVMDGLLPGAESTLSHTPGTGVVVGLSELFKRVDSILLLSNRTAASPPSSAAAAAPTASVIDAGTQKELLDLMSPLVVIFVMYRILRSTVHARHRPLTTVRNKRPNVSLFITGESETQGSYAAD